MQRAAQDAGELGVAAARYVRRGNHDVETVRCTLVDVKFGRYPGLEETGGVGDGLVAEQVGSTSREERWRKACQIGGPGRGRVPGHVRGGGVRTQVRAPAQLVRGSAPYHRAVQLARRRDLP